MRGRYSPEATSAAMMRFNRAAFTMSMFVWIIICIMIAIVFLDGAIGGRLCLLMVLGGLGACLILWASINAYLVLQWRLLTQPIIPPTPTKQLRSIPLNRGENNTHVTWIE